jgi:hypothetical protein
MGAQGFGDSGLWGRLDEDGGGECGVGDGDFANTAGPKPENKNKIISYMTRFIIEVSGFNRCGS